MNGNNCASIPSPSQKWLVEPRGCRRLRSRDGLRLHQMLCVSSRQVRVDGVFPVHTPFMIAWLKSLIQRFCEALYQYVHFFHAGLVTSGFASALSASTYTPEGRRESSTQPGVQPATINAPLPILSIFVSSCNASFKFERVRCTEH